MKSALFIGLAATCIASTACGAIYDVEPGAPNVGNYWPINNEVGGMHWQQVYDDSFFGSSAITITAFGFRGYANGDTGSISYGSDFVVRMSTTAIEPGSLSTTFASNVGGNVATVLSGPITWSSSPGNYTMMTLDTPFTYDPAMGNLLIEVAHSAPVSGTVRYFDAYNPTPTGIQRIAIDSSSATVGTNWGFGELVTRFEATAETAVPEPSSMGVWSLLAALASIGWWRRRRAR